LAALITAALTPFMPNRDLIFWFSIMDPVDGMGIDQRDVVEAQVKFLF
jgi:hypothetical protein